ncbi:MAG: cytochrome c [Paracoccaceae bacterium]|jgi:cytochrome c
MKNIFALAAAGLIFAVPAFAESHSAAMPAGDVAAGEAAFGKQCVACHVVKNEAGETLAGRASKTGPNLYAIAGRQAGVVEDFRYGKDTVTAGEENALVWNEEAFVAYVQDPTGYLREVTDNKRARSKMSYKVRSADDAVNLYAYLYSLAPPAMN